MREMDFIIIGRRSHLVRRKHGRWWNEPTNIDSFLQLRYKAQSVCRNGNDVDDDECQNYSLELSNNLI